MNKHGRKHRIERNIVAIVISFLLIGGCASPKLEKQDPFFDEWKTKAEASKGYSPAKPKPASEQAQIIKPKVTPQVAKIDEIAERPLPKRKISLKMSDIDVSVVLRALARGKGHEAALLPRLDLARPSVVPVEDGVEDGVLNDPRACTSASVLRWSVFRKWKSSRSTVLVRASNSPRCGRTGFVSTCV